MREKQEQDPDRDEPQLERLKKEYDASPKPLELPPKNQQSQLLFLQPYLRKLQVVMELD
jgi:hypothetical protein